MQPGRELVREFNQAGQEAPNKRQRTGEGIIFENGKEIGESMYQSLVTTTDATAFAHRSNSGAGHSGSDLKGSQMDRQRDLDQEHQRQQAAMAGAYHSVKRED